MRFLEGARVAKPWQRGKGPNHLCHLHLCPSKPQTPLNSICDIVKIVIPIIRTIPTAAIIDIAPISYGFRESAKRRPATISCAVNSYRSWGINISVEVQARVTLIAQRPSVRYHFLGFIERPTVRAKGSARSNREINIT
jgi:hypothetical protein